jgi:hypothetical protein
MRAPIPPQLLWPLAASLGFSLFSWGKYALYPFRLFTTWVHECCHALTAVLLGGSVKKITLAADTSGLTHYQLPKGRVRQALVASSGYLGTCAVGCALYSLSLVSHRHAHQLVLSLGALMLLSLLAWIRGFFGALAVASIGTGLIALGRLGPGPYSEPLFAFLSIQTGLQALLDIRTLFKIDPSARSDAQAMQSLFYLPAWFWALLWLAMSGAMAFWTVGRSLR